MAAENPRGLTICLALIILAASAGYFSIGPFASLAAAFVMTASLADFLFPVTYIISEDKAECRMLFKSAEIRWKNVRRCYLDDFGIKLSPLGRRTRLEAFRGVYLRFSHNDQQVTEAVQSLRAKCNE